MTALALGGIEFVAICVLGMLYLLERGTRIRLGDRVKTQEQMLVDDAAQYERKRLEMMANADKDAAKIAIQDDQIRDLKEQLEAKNTRSVRAVSSPARNWRDFEQRYQSREAEVQQ